MIRTPPQHATETPPGQVVNPVSLPDYPKPLKEDISLWKADQYTERVLEIGYKKGWDACEAFYNKKHSPDADNSESSR